MKKLISCVSLPPATITSVPIYDFAIANVHLQCKSMEIYYQCCGKSICGGCAHSFNTSGTVETCPFCNSNRRGKTDDELIEEIRKRVEANDPVSINLLANSYHHGLNGLQRDQAKAIKLSTRSAELGCSKAHFNLGHIYDEGGAPKKAKFHYGAAAMAEIEGARCNLEVVSANVEGIIESVVSTHAKDCPLSCLA